MSWVLTGTTRRESGHVATKYAQLRTYVFDYAFAYMCGSASDHNTYFATRNSFSLLWTSDKPYHLTPSETPE